MYFINNRQILGAILILKKDTVSTVKNRKAGLVYKLHIEKA